MINYAEIDRLKYQIASLKTQIANVEERICKVLAESSRIEEARCDVARRKAAFDAAISQELHNLLRIDAASSLRIASGYSSTMNGGYVGSCVRRNRADEAFRQMEKTIDTASAQCGKKLSRAKKEIASHQTTIDSLKQRIEQLRRMG